MKKKKSAQHLLQPTWKSENSSIDTILQRTANRTARRHLHHFLLPSSLAKNRLETVDKLAECCQLQFQLQHQQIKRLINDFFFSFSVLSISTFHSLTQRGMPHDAALVKCYVMLGVR